MATTAYTGNSVFTWLKPSGSGVYKKLVCETESEVGREAALIEAETKCEDLRAAGSIKFEKSNSFVAKFNPESDELSYAQLMTWFNAKAELDLLIADDETSPIIYSETGKVYITSFNTTYNTNEFVGGDITLSGSGATTLNIPV